MERVNMEKKIQFPKMLGLLCKFEGVTLKSVRHLFQSKGIIHMKFQKFVAFSFEVINNNCHDI